MNDIVKTDAQEFGRHLTQGGWRLGLLVARNVEPGTAGRPAANRRAHADSQKVSATEFASQANAGIPKGTKAKPNRDRISKDRVLGYLSAWEKAAEASIVPAAAKLEPGVEPDIDWGKLPEWGEFYTSVSGGFNGGRGRTPTVRQAKEVLSALPPTAAAVVLTEALAGDEVVEALKEDEESFDRVFDVLSRTTPARGKSASRKKNRKVTEMLITLELIGVLGKVRDLAKEDSDSPLIVECRNLLRETLGILDGIAEADDPEVVGRMFSDLDDFLASQA